MAIVVAPAFDIVYGVKEAEICNKALSSIGGELIRDTLEDTKQSRVCRNVYQDTRDELLRNYPFNFATKIAMIPNDDAYVQPMDEFTYAYKVEDHEAFTGTANTASTITAVAGITIDDRLIGRAVSGAFIQANTRILSVDAILGTITLDRATTGAATSFTSYIPIIKILEIATNENNIFEIVGGGSFKRLLTKVLSEQGDDLIYRLELKYVEQVIDPAKFDSMFSHALALRIASKIAIDITKDPRISQMMQQEFSSIFQAAKISSSEEKQLDAPDPWWTDREASATTQRR